MKILFVATNRLKRIMPPMPLGLASVIAQIDESRHDIKVLDCMFSENPAAEIEAAVSEFQPDLIAMSIRNLDNQCYLQSEFLMPDAKLAVDVCRAGSKAPIVVGGGAPTVCPEAVLDYLEADFVISGEGELVFRDLVDRLEKKQDWSDLPGLVWRDGNGVNSNPREFIDDLDSLKPPRRDLFDNARYVAAGGFGNIVIKQGCTFRCLYCDGPIAMGPKWRKRSPEKIVDEMEVMQREHGINVSFFTDAIFNCPPGHAKDVCREIIRRKPGLFWVTTVHPAYIDKELIELMQQAGCTAVSLGCDTASEKMLKVLRKDVTKDQLQAAAELLEEAGLNYILSLLIGAPGEDRATVEETVAFLEKRTPFMADFCVGIRLMPGTALVDIAIEEGVISADDPLMEPKFYLAPEIKDWIEDYLTEVCAGHPNWTLAHRE
jgi:radical SAM superfamily enzyme YgiQ (UPF0313 family)